MLADVHSDSADEPNPFLLRMSIPVAPAGNVAVPCGGLIAVCSWGFGGLGFPALPCVAFSPAARGKPIRMVGWNRLGVAASRRRAGRAPDSRFHSADAD